MSAQTRTTTPRLRLLLATVFVALLLASCTDATQTVPADNEEQAAPAQARAGSTDADEQTDDATERVEYVGEFDVSPGEATIGSVVQATGAGFAANTDLVLEWQSWEGDWKVDPDAVDNFKGREYTQTMEPLTTVTTDDEGAFETELTVPEGFGFRHDIRVMEDDTVRNKTSFMVEMEVSVSPEAGPPGSPITIKARGIGVDAMDNSWQVSYDNQFTGWISAVTTNGNAEFTIPATGGAGTHVIKVLHGSFTFPYLNMQQSPRPERPTWTFTFEVTDGEAVLPPPASDQGPEPILADGPPSGSDTAVWLDVAEGRPGMEANLSGRALPPSTGVDITWQTKVGADTQTIGGSGAERPETEIDLGTATTSAEGTLSWSFDLPIDAGGQHVIGVRDDDDEVLATTDVRIRPMAHAITPTEGPAGTEVTLHLNGVDDTDTGKIFMLVYDNAMLGYSCAVTSGGDITIYLPAAGEPGWHFIDLYPGIYKGEDIPYVYNFRIPQLTYADDHPGESDIPAFRFAFYVTE